LDDRFGKHRVKTLAELDTYGVTFVCVHDNLDLSTPQGRVMWGAICSELIRERARWNARRIPPSPKTSKQPGESWGEHSLRVMRKEGIPLTRENYLQRYFGDPNYEPDADEEVDMPDQFRRLIGPTPR
jgi:DNA invertase Pin-like site-specific DNA recombinase